MGLLYHMELADQLDLLRRCSGTVTILDTHHSNAPTHLEAGYRPHVHGTATGSSHLAGRRPAGGVGEPDLVLGDPARTFVRMLHDCGFGTILALVPPTLRTGRSTCASRPDPPPIDRLASPASTVDQSAYVTVAIDR